MTLQTMKLSFAAAAVAAGLSLMGSGAALAQASVMKECGAEYQAAKSANSLAGKTWNQFLADCRVRKAANPAPAPAAAPAAPANPLKPTPAAAPKPAPAAPAPAPSAAGPAVYPKAIDPKYSSLSAGRGRQKTCADQYNANKATNSNGGMRWIEKGGGYWSMCNKHLKGEG